jgi:hypothetical protein
LLLRAYLQFTKDEIDELVCVIPIRMASEVLRRKMVFVRQEFSMPPRLRNWRSIGCVGVSQFLLAVRPAVTPVLVGAILCVVVDACSGRQVNQERIKRKIVIAEDLLVESSVDGVHARFSAGAADDPGISFVNSNTSSRLRIVLDIAHDRPYMSLMNKSSNTRMDVNMVTPREPFIQMQNGAPKAELSLGVYENNQPTVSMSDSHDVRINLSGQYREGGPVGLYVKNKAGSEIIKLSRSAKLVSTALFDNQSHVRAIVGIVTGKAPSFESYDCSLNRLLELTEDAVGRPTIKLNDPVARESRTFK